MGTSYIYKRDASRLFIALRENGKRFKIYIPKESQPVIDGIEQDIDFVEQEDFHYAFDWKGKRFHCELVSHDQNKAVIKVNGVEYKYSLESLFSLVLDLHLRLMFFNQLHFLLDWQQFHHLLPTLVQSQVQIYYFLEILLKMII